MRKCHRQDEATAAACGQRKEGNGIPFPVSIVPQGGVLPVQARSLLVRNMVTMTTQRVRGLTILTPMETLILPYLTVHKYRPLE